MDCGVNTKKHEYACAKPRTTQSFGTTEIVEKGGTGVKGYRNKAIESKLSWID